jgi:hypothetical protein
VPGQVDSVNVRVVGAQVADLNDNGMPTIYVTVQAAGSGRGRGSYGELAAYAVTRSSDPSPIYAPGDSNAKASGGERQICYKLKAVEASWILRRTSVLKF